MILLQKPDLTEPRECPYVSEIMCRFEYFFAMDLCPDKLNELLENGWRKFGIYYFRPDCLGCLRCVPIRINVDRFIPSRSQKRVMKKGTEIEVRFKPLEYREEIYDIYREHSWTRFGNVTGVDEFTASFYTPSCPSFQSEYYLNDELFAVGFLDRSQNSLSSVYMVYKKDFEKFSPGTLSILREIEYASSLNLKYYYLGYYIEDNSSMCYKNRFHVHEKYDWIKKEWIEENPD